MKLYLYGYLHRVRSSRRLEAECQRNLEVIWLILAYNFRRVLTILSLEAFRSYCLNSRLPRPALSSQETKLTATQPEKGSPDDAANLSFFPLLPFGLVIVDDIIVFRLKRSFLATISNILSQSGNVGTRKTRKE